MSFSVIIPSKTIDNLRPCVSCIRLAKEKADIIVVDDFDGDSQFPFLPPLSRQFGGELPQALAASLWVKGIRPFVFARNINLGIAAAGDDDVVLLNDDACLTTPFGFSYLAAIAKDHPEYGIISAGITAAVGNEEQLAQPGTRLREAKHHTLVFVCVYIRREVLDQIKRPGMDQWLDEDYLAYGHDDDQACAEVRKLGLKLGIFDGCVVEHGVLPSTFRGSGVSSHSDLAPNREVFMRKWGCLPKDLRFPHEIQPVPEKLKL